MRILNVCRADWANFAWDNAQALRTIYDDVRAIKLNGHQFNYPEACDVVFPEEMVAEMKLADVIQVHHSDMTVLELIQENGLESKPIVVYHAGSVYRRDPDYMNAVWNPVCNRSVNCLGEFMGLGAKNELYLVGAIDTDKLQPNFTSCNKPLVIMHKPSSQGKKGTDKIHQMMSQLKLRDTFIFDDSDFKQTSHSDYLLDIANSDIYIELFKPTLEGKPYGSFGITGLEAPALGKITVTNMLWYETYEKHYGDLGLVVTNTEEEFIEAIETLIAMKPTELRDLQRASRQWVETKHSYPATAAYLKKHLFDGLA